MTCQLSVSRHGENETYTALATNGKVSLTLSSLVQLVDHHTSTQLESRPSVAATSRLVVLDELDVAQVMGPERQSTSSGVLAEEVMASVVNNKTEVKRASKVDAQLDLGDGADVDGVLGVSANGALLSTSSVGGLAGGVLIEGGHDRSRVINAVSMICQLLAPSIRVARRYSLSIRAVPVVQQIGTLGGIIMLALVAGRTERHSLDQGTAGENVKDLPERIAGPSSIAGQDLALGLIESSLLGAVDLIIEVEERDIAQLQVSEVGQGSLGELLALEALVARYRLSGRLDVGFVRLCKSN
jgi:hypothetical protein